MPHEKYLILAIQCISVTLIKKHTQKKEQKPKQTNKQTNKQTSKKDNTKKHEIIQCEHFFK